MKFYGNEIINMCAKGENGELKFTISFLKLEQLINSYILNRILDELKESSDITKLSIEYLTINNLKVSKGTNVKLKFNVTMKETVPILENRVYEASINELDIKEFYNHIVDLFEGYAYELDTEIDNIKIELKELEILDK